MASLIFRFLYLWKIVVLYSLLCILTSCYHDSNLADKLLEIEEVDNYFAAINFTPTTNTAVKGVYLLSLHGSQALAPVLVPASKTIFPVFPIRTEGDTVFSVYKHFDTPYPNNEAVFTFVAPFRSKNLPNTIAETGFIHPIPIVSATTYHFDITGQADPTPDTYKVTYLEDTNIPKDAIQIKHLAKDTETITYHFKMYPNNEKEYYLAGYNYQLTSSFDMFKTEKIIRSRISNNRFELITTRTNYKNGILADFPRESFGTKPYGKNGTDSAQILEIVKNISTPIDSTQNTSTTTTSYYNGALTIAFQELEKDVYYNTKLKLLQSKEVHSWSFDKTFADIKYNYSLQKTDYVNNPSQGLFGLPAHTVQFTFVSGLATRNWEKLYTYNTWGLPKTIQTKDTTGTVTETEEFTYDAKNRLTKQETIDNKLNQCKDQSEKIENVYTDIEENLDSITEKKFICNTGTYTLTSQKTTHYSTDLQPTDIITYDVSTTPAEATQETIISYSYYKQKKQEQFLELPSKKELYRVLYSYDANHFFISAITVDPDNNLTKGYDHSSYEYK